MKKIFFLIIIIFSLTGCFLDPYKNKSAAESAINSWFSFKNGEDDLGITRKRIENINEIKNATCLYIENDINKNYIYKCTVEYTPIGETIIPLSKNEKKDFVVLISYNDDRTYNYVVYNSSYKIEDTPWLYDDSINYNKK